ncbi:MAG: helix-turn-helix domain-containing protein [Patescibacteria group bacterium]
MDITHKTLSDFGLSKNEIIVYLESIKHDQISPFKLARLTQIPRTTVYDVMMSLALKGLITIKTSHGLEKQQTWIIPKNPSTLRDMIFHRRQDLLQLEVDLTDILSDLQKDYLKHENNAGMRFYPGIEGVKRVYTFIHQIPSQVQIYMWDQLMPVDTLGKEYINKEVSQGLKIKKRVKRVKTIIPLNDWTRHVLSYQYGRNNNYIDYHEFRYIEKPFFNLNQDIYVFSDRIALMCAKKDEVWGMIIKSKLLYTTFTSLFQVMWEIAKPVDAEFMEQIGENEFLIQEKKKVPRY